MRVRITHAHRLKLAGCFLCAILCSTTYARADKANLLGDPGFELCTNPGGYPNSGYWNDDHIGEAGAVLDGAAGHVRSGIYSLHVYTGTGVMDTLSRSFHNDVVAVPSAFYSAGAYICTPTGYPWQTGSHAFVRLSFRNIAHGEISYADTPPYQNATPAWQLNVLTNEIAPLATAYARFIIYLEKPGGSSSQSVVNVDDCFLYEVIPEPQFMLALMASIWILCQVKRRSECLASLMHGDMNTGLKQLLNKRAEAYRP